MPKKRPSLRKDENETAYALVQATIGEGPRPQPPGQREKNPEAVDRDRLEAREAALEVDTALLIRHERKGKRG